MPSTEASLLTVKCGSLVGSARHLLLLKVHSNSSREQSNRHWAAA
jgi:hypothetical protein